jgi:hypothetical protein
MLKSLLKKAFTPQITIYLISETSARNGRRRGNEEYGQKIRSLMILSEIIGWRQQSNQQMTQLIIRPSTTEDPETEEETSRSWS